MEGEADSKEYEDLLPVMADKLDEDTFIAELCGGFRLLADPAKGLITPSSLQKNCALLGLEGMLSNDMFRGHLSQILQDNMVNLGHGNITL
ncbi:hypothetical protein CDL12_02719 [Handroanthus impetiginosus]|uniref:Uncharacterized protein n=1 Tax=Handroanthus impetiginosus TaxID=429701 RepID=A0A2G9I460_9LAMI|nr:hypothetical protein CDL12_02719 [Handroanthus impetiginosus]